MIKNSFRSSNINGQNLLHQAIEDFDYARVRFLLDRDEKLSDHYFKNRCYTPLHLAAFLGHQDIVLLLLAKGAPTNKKLLPNVDSDQLTFPIYYAIQNRHMNIVKILQSFPPIEEPFLQYGFIMQILRITQRRLLSIAAQTNNLEMIQWLIKTDNIGNIHEKDHWSLGHPLRTAVDNQNMKVIEYLLKVIQINPNHVFDQSTCQFNPLYIAVRSKNLGIARLLLQYGANPLGCNHVKRQPDTNFKNEDWFHHPFLLATHHLASINQNQSLETACPKYSYFVPQGIKSGDSTLKKIFFALHLATVCHTNNIQNLNPWVKFVLKVAYPDGDLLKTFESFISNAHYLWKFSSLKATVQYLQLMPNERTLFFTMYTVLCRNSNAKIHTLPLELFIKIVKNTFSLEEFKLFTQHYEACQRLHSPQLNAIKNAISFNRNS